MKHAICLSDSGVLKRILFSIGLLLSLIIGNASLYSVPVTEDWETYQNEVLKEQPNFPGWCPLTKAKHIMNLLLAHNSEICVELGVYGGSSFFPIASTLAFKKQGMAYAVDPWSNEACLEGYEDLNDNLPKYWGKVDLEKVMGKFTDGMHRNGLDGTFEIMRLTSAEAYLLFDDESVDFIHIDGNHSEKSAIFDVEHWLPKVKKKGIICFDDAWWKSTQPAIKIMLKECDIMKESSPHWQYIFLQKR